MIRTFIYILHIAEMLESFLLRFGHDKYELLKKCFTLLTSHGKLYNEIDMFVITELSQDLIELETFMSIPDMPGDDDASPDDAMSVDTESDTGKWIYWGKP